MRLIDTHSHLEWNSLYEKLEQVVKGAKENGLIGIITSSVWLDTAPVGIKIAHKYENFIFPSIGFAPTEAAKKPATFEPFKQFVLEHSNQMIGLGEIGLDYYWIKDKVIRKDVENKFIELIQLSETINKPIVIHCRDAEQRVIELIEEYCNHDRVHMHCFSGPSHLVKRALKNGWCFSVPTSVVNRKYHQKLAENVPLERMFLETDAPFLSPLKDQKINEPKNIAISAVRIANMKNTTPDNVADITTANAIEFYSLPI
ncbi:MAG: TatD family hydrolase [Candidatus Lokiarchaeota archaeon]|nr:TatD family hydrolase [Candidatus Lokiarchaeota archaeon]